MGPTLAEGYTKRVVTISPGASTQGAADTMTQEGVGSLVVTGDGGRAVGVVTDRDIVLRVLAASVEPERLTVREIMTPDPVSVAPNELVDVAIERMSREGRRRLPVLDDGVPVGMVSLDDLVQVLSRALLDLSEATWGETARQPSPAVGGAADDLGQLVERMRTALRKGNWFARETFLQELDDLRDRVRQVLHLGH